MTDSKKPTTTPEPSKPATPPVSQPPKFVPPTKPNFGGFGKNQRFPMPTIPRGVR